MNRVKTNTPVVLEKKHPLAIRWFHWINFPVLAIMIWSGLLIYWANDVYSLKIGSITVLKMFPQSVYKKFDLESKLADGMAWHFLFMWVYAINGILYVLYTAISGQWRNLLPGRGALKESVLVVLHDLKLYEGTLPRRKFNAAQQIAYTLVVLMGLGSLLTGIAIYRPIQASWLTSLLGGYVVCRFIHFWLTMGYVVFFTIHVGQVIKTGWNNFRAMVTGYELVPVEEAGELA